MAIILVNTLHYHFCPNCNKDWEHDNKDCARFVPSFPPEPKRRSLFMCPDCSINQKSWKQNLKGD